MNHGTVDEQINVKEDLERIGFFVSGGTRKAAVPSNNHQHDAVIKHFPRYWPFVRGIHRSPGEFPS